MPVSTKIIGKKVPKLRFKIFNEEWKEEQLDNLVKTYDGTHQTPRYVDSGIPFYSVEHVTANQFSKTKFISEEVYSKEIERVKIEKNDILMTRIGSIGVARLIDWDVKASFYVSLALLKNSEVLSSRFLVYYIATDKFQRELYKRTIHVAFPQKINLGEIGQCYACFPPKEEQQKIASFLTVVDKKIEQLTNKKQLLEQYKKGVMQQLFSQKLRFKGFGKEWKEKRLSDIGIHFNGLTGKTSDDFGAGKPVITYKQIFDNSTIQIEKCGYVNVAENEKQNTARYGDVFFTVSSESPEEVGFASVLLEKNIEPFLNSFCFGFRIDQSILYPYFSRYLFNSSQFRKIVIPLAQGSTRYNMSKTAFLKLETIFPSLKEQQKIASFLMVIDLKIEAVEQQIDKAKEWKKGLLQQMFV